MKELMPLTNVNAVAIFQEDGLDELLKQIHAEAESHVPDLTTDKGRKTIASIAAKVAKSKTYLDGLGKDMVSGWKNQAKVVDAERRKMRDDLDELKISIRQPLTNFENTENERVERVQSVIAEIAVLGSTAETEWVQLTLDEIKYFMEKANKLYRENEFDEQGSYAAEVIEKAKGKIIDAMDQREKYDNERADLERLRAEAAMRDAEVNKKAAAQKIKDDQKKAAEDAVEKERRRADAKREADNNAAIAREADTKHRRLTNNKAADAIAGQGVDIVVARKIVKAIAKNEIPNITIAY